MGLQRVRHDWVTELILLQILEKLGFSFNLIWHGYFHLDSNIVFLIFKYLKKKRVVCLHQRHINGIDFLDCVKDMRKEKEVNPVCNCVAFKYTASTVSSPQSGVVHFRSEFAVLQVTMCRCRSLSHIYWRVSSCVVAALIFWEPHLHPRHALCYVVCPPPQPSRGMPLAPLAPEKSPLRIVWFHTMQLQCLWEQETNKEGHQQPTSQVLSLLASFGVDTTPQNMDQDSMGVNIAAEQGTQEPSSGYHLARALLFSNAKCICCVLISYLCWNTVPHWCFWKILTLPQHRSITKDRKQ